MDNMLVDGNIEKTRNGPLPFTLLAGLIGLILGLFPATVYTFVSTGLASSIDPGDGILDFLNRNMFYPLFIAAPLLMHFFNKILKGRRDIYAIIVIAVFSLVCTYLTALSCVAAFLAVLTGTSFAEVAVLVAGQGYIPFSNSASAYLYPLLFTALGVVISAQLLRISKKPRNAEEAEAEDAEGKGDADDSDAEEAEGSEAAADAAETEVAEAAADVAETEAAEAAAGAEDAEEADAAVDAAEAEGAEEAEVSADAEDAEEAEEP